jgi:hypothetical protein
MSSRATAVVLALWGVLALSGCNRDPRCRGELSGEEIARLEDLSARGAAPCPELRDPTVRLGAKGIELSGRVIATRDELPRDGYARPITVLHAELAQNRATWSRVHPREKFEGRASIELAPASDFIAGASTIVSVVKAGYPQARVDVGGVSFEATFELTRPPRGSSEPPRDLYIERKSDGKHSAEIREGKIVVTYLENPSGVDGVTSWIDKTCAVTRCDAIELQMPGEFRLTADLLRRLLSLETFTKRPPTLRFKAG